ncbi:hypothetical protein G3570_04640 [Balneolaceae bacterium YR4-1]|uniref:Uncharacterized protein n=1 Tax=Halalkalibaculum roseum TaxID=2709311 RepID=A0A6M1SLN6_9BACT|nr:hypothetical protein [Halalkalibaculum roseum]NGP75909.1 hypothetical protein [Halalkalibaculum roseum]
MGRATTAITESDWSLFANPAMISTSYTGISFFGVRYYGLDELTDLAVAVVLPSAIGSLAFGAHRFGDEFYNESRLRIGYKNEYQGFHFGLVANYNHLAIGGGYGSAGAIGLDVGIAAMILNGLWVAAKAVNINQPTYGKYKGLSEELARDLSIGLSYQIADLLLFSIEAVKDIRFPISYRAGIDAKILGSFRGRAGVTTEPVTLAGGFGISSKSWAVNIGVQQHENPILGMSPAMDFRLSW